MINVQSVSKEEAAVIIKRKQPQGLFYYKDNDSYVAIDNACGKVEIKKFTGLYECLTWLI